MDFVNILLDPTTERKITDKSPDKLPLNPSAQGWTGAEIRRFLAKPIFDGSNSILSEFKNKMVIIKQKFEETNNAMVANLSCGYFKNNEESMVNKGEFVYVSGVIGGDICVNRALSSSVELFKSVGIAMSLDDVPSGSHGIFVFAGAVNGITPEDVMENVNDLEGLQLPTRLYLSSVYGKLTVVEPSAPLPNVCVGYLIYNDSTLAIQIIPSISSSGDIVKLPTFDSFPLIGRESTMYIALDTNIVYHWHNNEYHVASPGKDIVFSEVEPEDLSEGSFWYKPI